MHRYGENVHCSLVGLKQTAVCCIFLWCLNAAFGPYKNTGHFALFWSTRLQEPRMLLSGAEQLESDQSAGTK